jgi:tripartite ATP-independent transporter DctP family solute receptor
MVLLKSRMECIKMISKFSCSLLFGFIVLLAGCGEREQVKVLKLAHILDPSTPVHQAMMVMNERLEVLSGGQMRIDIYASGQLGNERECLELLQLGSLDITKVSSSVVENFVPAMGVFSLPYLFEDQDHYWQVFNGEIGKEILLQGEPYWLRGLCFYDAGFRSFFTNGKAVHKPDDLDGLKIRVMRSNLSIRTINLLGGHATPLAYSELYSALQQGVVDGAENNPPNFYQMKFYELCRHFVLDEHSAPPDVLLMSTHTWNKLSEQEKEWLEKAVAESVVYQRKLWDEMTQSALEAVQAAGVTVIRPDKKPFQEVVKPIYDELKEHDLGKWITRIKEVAQVAPGH